MNEYKDIASDMGFPQLARCISQELPCPLAYCDVPPRWYGFPPALIPVWSQSLLYFGIWKHWFLDREPSIVKMYISGDGNVSEIARTEDQFFAHVAMLAIVEEDGVTASIKNYARLTGLNNLSEIDEMTLTYDDDPKGLLALPQFIRQPQHASIGEDMAYDGEFPIAGRIKGNSLCDFDFPVQELTANRTGTDILPRWLRSEESKSELFYAHLHAGNLGAAWLSLNSRGWSIDSARKALIQLKDAADDEAFGRLAHAWLSIADTSVGGY